MNHLLYLDSHMIQSSNLLNTYSKKTIKCIDLFVELYGMYGIVLLFKTTIILLLLLYLSVSSVKWLSAQRVCK